MVSTIASLVTISHTATNDSAFRLTDHDIPFFDANFHVAAQAAKYGDMTAQNADAAVGDVITFRNGNIKDIWFINAAGGANTQIICVATVPNKYVKSELGGLI